MQTITITIEGPIASGKTTVARLIRGALKDAGVTAELAGDEAGEMNEYEVHKHMGARIAAVSGNTIVEITTRCPPRLARVK